MLLASGGVDQAIKLWNPTTGVCLQVLNGHTSAIWSLAFSPDGQSLLSGSKDETLKLWDMHDFSCLETLCPERLYENMQITGVTGLTDAQRDTLKALGAIESSVYSF
uniref:WD40 repeat domain-containing protein n=1 Tax=Desertifilum tharense IPPAS B-1220 TaxID=1781255 RepID=A0ACD5GTZ5_9CYAN